MKRKAKRKAKTEKSVKGKEEKEIEVKTIPGGGH